MIFWVMDLPEWNSVFHATCEQNLERRQHVILAACHKLDLDEKQLLCFNVNNTSPQLTNLPIIFGIRGSKHWVNCWWSQTIVVSEVRRWLEILGLSRVNSWAFSQRKSNLQETVSITSQRNVHNHGSSVTLTVDT